jgi:hypothetical protein
MQGQQRGGRGAVCERVSALREETLVILDRCSGGEQVTAEVVVALQHAANELGTAEAALRPAPAPRLEPAPIVGTADSPSYGTMAMTAEAAAVLSLAESSVVLASSPQDEAERWLRLLRQHGGVGAALATLGVSDRPLATAADLAAVPASGSSRNDRVGPVALEARDFARRRGAEAVTTVDLLFAVTARHRGLFDRALYGAGTSRRALVDALGAGTSVARTS